MENKIVINNASQCMEILNSILNKTYPEERVKYASYVSMAYFVKNLNLFQRNDVEKVLNDEKLSLSIASKSTYELLENAINTNTVFTIYSKKWFHNVKANQPLLEKYLELLLTTEDAKQIEDFCNANPALSKNYYKTKEVNNYTFEKYVIGNNPELIKKQTLLSEEDVTDLIEKGLLKYNHIKEIFTNYSYKLQTLATKEEVKFLLKHNLEQETTQEVYDLIRENPVFFMTKLKEINPDYTRKLLSTEGASTIGDHPKQTCNLLQSIVESNSSKSLVLKNVLTLALDGYKDILFKDVKKTIGMMKYEYAIDYFLHLYEVKEYNVFKGLSYFNEELTPKQRNIVLTGNFDSLLSNYENFKNNSKEFDVAKYIRPLLCFTYTELEEKVKQMKTNDKVEESLILEIEKYILHNKLNENLIITNTKEKKLKI